MTISGNSNETLPSRAGRDHGSKYSQRDIDLLAQLVYSEAAGEPYSGHVAVATSVLNRIDSSIYPNTTPGAVFQVSHGYYQYCPVLDGRINNEPHKTAYRAVYEALVGRDHYKNALGFYNPRKTSNQWFRCQRVTTVIGNHVFFR